MGGNHSAPPGIFKGLNSMTDQRKIVDAAGLLDPDFARAASS
jgi:hypothetical protein